MIGPPPPAPPTAVLVRLMLKAFGLLLILTVIVLAWSRAPDLPVEALVSRWAPAPSDFVEVRGMVVHLRDEGPREDPHPIVLLHGTSASLHTWEGWVAALRGQRRVITLDLPGFGLTGPFTGQYPAGDYGGEAYARFVLDVMDRLRVPSAVLGGNSLGGEIAWRLALLAPQRVQALVLVDAAGPAFRPEQIPAGWQLARVPVANRLLEWVLPRSLVAEGLTVVYGDPGKVTPELVDRYFTLTLREGNRRALLDRLRHWQTGADADRINGVTQPTLILWGGRDRLIPPAVGEEFERRIQGSRRIVFPELGHVPQEEDPAQTVAVVRSWLAGLPR